MVYFDQDKVRRPARTRRNFSDNIDDPHKYPRYPQKWIVKNEQTIYDGNIPESDIY